MKYKGIELKEITKQQIVDPPREMLVWDSETDKLEREPRKEMVYAIVKLGTHYVAITSSYQWEFCAEIPEEPKPRRATNMELAKWLAQGKGQILGTKISTIYDYNAGLADNGEVPKFFKVRKWEDTDWHEATVDYMGIE